MRIKIAIIDGDENYLRRLSASLTKKYNSRVRVSGFTSVEYALTSYRDSKYDLFLVSEKIDPSCLPEEKIILLTEESGSLSIDGKPAINKYQRVNTIYTKILDAFNTVYASFEYTPEADSTKDGKIIMFTSFSGGTGVTTVSMAVAEALASDMYKVCYISMGCFANPGIQFVNDGEKNFSDVVYAIKGKKGNLAVKLESMMSQSFSNVYYFAKPNLCIDVVEMSVDDWVKLISTLSNDFDFDYIILDTDMVFDFSEKITKISCIADKIILINDGSNAANAKFESAYKSLFLFEDAKKCFFSDKMLLLYNRFSQKTSLELSNISIKCIGGVSRIDQLSVGNIVNYMSTHYKKLFGELI